LPAGRVPSAFEGVAFSETADFALRAAADPSADRRLAVFSSLERAASAPPAFAPRLRAAAALAVDGDSVDADVFLAMTNLRKDVLR
jgi:hypothetical protein